MRRNRVVHAMDLVLFGKYKGNHGPSRVTRGLSRALAEQGHDITLLTYGDREDPPSDGVKLERVAPMPSSVKGWLDLYRKVRRRVSDADGLFHALERYPYVSDIRTVQWTSDMYVVWRRTGVRPPMRSLAGDVLLNWYSRLGAKRARYIVAQSPETERQMDQYWRITSDQIIPLGIEPEFLSPPSVTHDPAQVLLVGRIDLRKGQVALLKGLTPDSEQYNLHIVGGMADEAYGEPVVADWQEEYLGYLSDSNLEAAYEDADIVVVPSYLETFSMVGLEALAKGCALVITEDCGLAQFDWANEENGVFVARDRSDAAQLVEKVAASGKLDAYKQRAYDLGTSLTWDVAAQQYTEIYSRIVDQR